MVVDAVRTYLDAASGLTELSRKEAVAAAKALLRANGTAAPERTSGEALPPRVGQSIQALAGELIETSQANRAAIAALVRSEVERQLERMDVVPRDEHDRLVRRVAELERRLAARHQVPERVAAPVAAVPESASGPATGAVDTRVAPAGDEDGAEPRPEPAAEGSADTTDTAPSAAGGSASAAQGASPEEPDTSEEPDTPEDRAEAGSKPAKAAGTSSKGRSTAKGSAKSTTRSSRSRSTGKGTAAKRTTKGKGTAKK
ncbi:membrane fusogenic activity family protein [Nocardiopsis sp. FIRDI 009]|uniref:accessory factor UbiK family protein n=1 Tax=Nocardiopsis sp. FIRDI 009 TaxID=714197 RepID=UPI000E2674B2|nr:membrane fusogenic activity family protein [Nocardiopsis sp. FIRDI 009]